MQNLQNKLTNDLWKVFGRERAMSLLESAENTETLSDLYKDEAVHKVCYSKKENKAPVRKQSDL